MTPLHFMVQFEPVQFISLFIFPPLFRITFNLEYGKNDIQSRTKLSEDISCSFF